MTIVPNRVFGSGTIDQCDIPNSCGTSDGGLSAVVCQRIGCYWPQAQQQAVELLCVSWGQ
ncbi:hypothetical protein [Tumebacillus algifaecis]|uniref:hypothetical protein n=1 Tax=Tumebacillus algifaecis TaxID=1214604 RepID=UPI0012FD8612|nr:hypothetical protein [Tumebacillus algifaecis]